MSVTYKIAARRLRSSKFQEITSRYKKDQVNYYYYYLFIYYHFF